jgi:protein-S-isoprenylcysteine O-methyltransferase Ste14
VTGRTEVAPVDGQAPVAAAAGGQPQAVSRSEQTQAARLRELGARMFVCVLFTLLSINVLNGFMQTGHVTGLLLLASEALVVVFTVIRRRATVVDRSVLAAVSTTVSLSGPFLVRVTGAGGLVRDELTAAVSAIGLVIVIAGKLILGRRFGLVPANRGIVVRGPYTVVRHPIYTGYLITHLAFLVANPSAWNVAVIVVSDTALVIRALREEKVLKADAAYQQYCQRVAWHLVPGVF